MFMNNDSSWKKNNEYKRQHTFIAVIRVIAPTATHSHTQKEWQMKKKRNMIHFKHLIGSSYFLWFWDPFQWCRTACHQSNQTKPNQNQSLKFHRTVHKYNGRSNGENEWKNPQIIKCTKRHRYSFKNHKNTPTHEKNLHEFQNSDKRNLLPIHLSGIHTKNAISFGLAQNLGDHLPAIPLKLIRKVAHKKIIDTQLGELVERNTRRKMKSPWNFA